MIFQSQSTQDMASNPYAHAKMPHQTSASQLKIVSFNIWDLPYWFVKNRKQCILQIAEIFAETRCRDHLSARIF